MCIPTHSATHSDHIRPPGPMYSATSDAMPRGSGFRVSGLGFFVSIFGDGSSHGRAVEFDAVRVVNDAI